MSRERQARFNMPTDQEIEIAHNSMLPEMDDGDTAVRMGHMAAGNRMLRYQVRKLLRNAFVSVDAGLMTPTQAMESVVGSAMAYGLHLGIHVGLARRTKEAVQ
jgi:hypothetical protein